MNARLDYQDWSKRAWGRALLLSVAVNVLFLGLVIGTFLRPPPAKKITEYGLKSFSRSLPSDRARLVSQMVEARRAEIRQFRQAARQARLDATTVLVSDPYDKERLAASLRKIDASESELRGLVSDIFLGTAAQLTLEERKALAAWWKARQPHLFWRKGARPPPSPAS
jgi:uncharacterized membrane protein